MISLYDSAHQRVLPIKPRDDGQISIYVCGPTVYGPPHLGHGRSVLVYDILRRYLTWAGIEVHHVSNITDIDDKIINRATSEGRDWSEVAVEWEAKWWESMDKLGVARPHDTPHASQYVTQMVELIEELVVAGSAYVTSDGVYLSVESIEGYGLLAHQSLESLREGGGDRDVHGSEKRHPADFALWKFSKPGEPVWPSPWGDGRPGWHTECVAMSLDILGENFDIHTGGLDLTFPHHENERAQAVALGKGFAERWMHHGFVELEGEKMSKSLGNVTNLVDFVDTYDPRAYRLLVLRSHYRSPMEVTSTAVVDAQAALARLDSFARRTEELAEATSQGDADAEVLGRFSNAMENDLDTAQGVDLLFRQVRAANTALDQGDKDGARRAAVTGRQIAIALGLEFHLADDQIPTKILELVETRQAARASRDFARADQIRDDLAEQGWVVEDSTEGPGVRKM